jgi:serine/threonine protein kinase
MTTATLRDGRTIDYLPDMIGDGAMKEVYFSRDRASVVCFYKDAQAGVDPVRLKRLEKILGPNNPTLSKTQGGAALDDAEAAYYRSLFCWPTAIVSKPRFGIVAPTYPNHFFFQSGPDFIKGKEKNGMRFIGRRNRTLLEKFAPTELGDFQKYLSLCVQMARAVSRLHNAGLAHADLSPNNVLVDPTRGVSIVIDVDSLVVEGLYPPDVAGTKGYIAPEVLSTLDLPLRDPLRKHPNARTDLHALPVLIYQYLLLRHPLDGRRVPNARSAEEQELLSYGKESLYCEHPTNTANRPEQNPYIPATGLGQPLAELFQRAFVDGLHTPNNRPAGLEWVRGLTRTWNLLQPCPNSSCAHKWFILGDPKMPPRCPFCGTRPPGVIPLLQLRRERTPGQWLVDTQLAVYHNLSLFKWHAYTDCLPGPNADRTPQAYCVFHQGQWLLVNQELDTLTSPGGNFVPRGQAVVLRPGETFRLAQGETGRGVLVEMVGGS